MNSPVSLSTTELDNLLQDCVQFAQRLIQTPSMPGEEAAAAQLIAAEMGRLAFDDAWLDDAGNVYGRLNGRDRSLPALVLNSHTDHVDPGDPSLWPIPPYSGAVVDGHLVGRGASDIKGPLAVQVYAMAGLLRAGLRPRRDVVFTGVVEEEVGGRGMVYWNRHRDYDVALLLLGEPSGNQMALGHRGMLSMWVTFHGRSVHASVPERGDNPNYALAVFLERLQRAQAGLSSHELLGQTTVAPTVIEVDTRSFNVTPAWTRVLLDFRTASESPRSLQAFVHKVAAEYPHVLTAAYDNMPLMDSGELLSGFYTPATEPAVSRVRQAVAAATGREPELSSYRFATDGRLVAAEGFPIIGYSPGEEAQAHVAGERIAIAAMAESLRGHLQVLHDY
ncbi:MAG: M20/M25/M40 family metallo-hydrolase [Anaerolineae bacterium]|nr:M20/M25/M40 family metallo-hydrolase [Anaerolineae bacterium]